MLSDANMIADKILLHRVEVDKSVKELGNSQN